MNELLKDIKTRGVCQLCTHRADGYLPSFAESLCEDCIHNPIRKDRFEFDEDYYSITYSEEASNE